jgi:hypothetical protein
LATSSKSVGVLAAEMASGSFRVNGKTSLRERQTESICEMKMSEKDKKKME